ncbi:PKD domain-containing protein [Arthrobacter sp. NPDC093139]|uniref:PKD domain-containing protein n=1 Tax=Arthrobacter sp. NPDC093139 TaxID=3363945 RepID=UPI003801F3BF
MSVASRVRSVISTMSGFHVLSTRGPAAPAGRPTHADNRSGPGVWRRERSALAALVTAGMATSLLITGYEAAAPRDSSSAHGSHVHNAALPAAAMQPAPDPVQRAGWTVSASDEEVSGGNGAAANVLDGNADTFWQSKGTATAAVPLAHAITIDTKVTQNITGLRYLPRPDVENGRIGSFEILVSTNGTAWGTPVAQGTWADTSAEKSVTFAAVTARYVQLRAISEAGNRGSWSSAAEINLVGQSDGGMMTTMAVNGVQGSWGPTINFPIVPAAAALLPGNKLLTWSAYSPTVFGGSNGYTQTSILNLATGAVSQTEVANTGHDMFCPGTSMLPDGRIIISGGSNSSKTTLYDPGSNTWTAGPAMKIARGYHSNVTTSTGEVFTIGGSWSGGIGNKHGELWSEAGGWRTLPNVLVDNILTDDPGEHHSDNHAWLFAAPGGRVFHAGPSRQMNWISTTGTGSITSAGLRSDSADAMNGDAVMYDIGKILTVGGAPAYKDTPATARAYTIDINNGATVARTADMAVSRSFANGVALPDGQVFVVGGQATPVQFTDTGARMSPEIWNPATGLWATMAPMAIPRTYHSVALLLPDARVFVGGGGLCPGSCSTNHLDGEIFTPPYLLNADGSARVRPEIVTAPATASPGSTIAVTTGAPTTKFSLMRMSTVTHTVNTDQRRIPLTATAVSGNTASLTLPADTGVLVPGNYMLFAVDADGVPSIASTINIGSTPPPPPPPSGTVTAVSSTTASATTATTAVTLTRPSGTTAGDVLVASFTADKNPTAAVPAGWTAIVNGLSISSGARVFAYYRVAGASEPPTYTWTLSTAVKWGAGVTAYRGVNNTTPLDSAVATAVNTTYRATSIAVPGVTTASNGSMLIGGLGFDSSNPAATPPSGWTERWETVAGGQIAEQADRTQATAGATGTATWTFSSAKAVAAWRTALKPAPKDPDTPAPVASFAASPTTGTAPLPVSFTDTSTGAPTSWSWDFGDGGTSTERNPSHTYTAAGTYTVRLTATNSGGSTSATATVTVDPAATPAPVASFTASPTTGTAPLPVSFSDTSTGAPTSWAWEFGDGVTSTEQNPSHTYTAAGTYTARMTATNSGGSTSATSTITVSPPAAPASGITARSSTTTNTSTATATVALAAPAGRTAGDVLVASFTADQNPTVAVPAGWTAIVNGLSIASSSTAGAKVFAYYRVVGAADPGTYTWTLSKAVKWGGGITAYTGVNTTTPLDSAVATAVNTSYTATSITVPGITTASNGAMLIGGLGFDSSNPAATPPTGWTERWEATGGQIAEQADRTQATAGAAGTATWTFSTAKAVGAWRTALKPAS